jgi:hypothetical protein
LIWQRFFWSRFTLLRFDVTKEIRAACSDELLYSGNARVEISGAPVGPALPVQGYIRA